MINSPTSWAVSPSARSVISQSLLKASIKPRTDEQVFLDKFTHNSIVCTTNKFSLKGFFVSMTVYAKFDNIFP